MNGSRLVLAVLLVAGVTSTAEHAAPLPGAGRYGRWDLIGRTDPMTDKVSYYISSAEGGIENSIMIFPGTGPELPLIVTALQHNHPGRDMRLRVDTNPALDIGRIGTGKSVEVLRQLLAGKRVIVEYYRWPYGTPRYAEQGLSGFKAAWEALQAQLATTPAPPAE